MFGALVRGSDVSGFGGLQFWRFTGVRGVSGGQGLGVWGLRDSLGCCIFLFSAVQGPVSEAYN